METNVERNFQLQFLFNLTFIYMVNELVQFIQNIYFKWIREHRKRFYERCVY